MLAPRTRAALRIGALLYVALGLVLFAVPAWAASEFPWAVSPVAAMSIGGWALGNGMGAWVAAAQGPAKQVLPVLVYLAVFSVAEIIVAVLFGHAFRLDVLLAAPYLVALGVTLVAAGLGILELRTAESIVVDEDQPLARRERILLTALAVFVGALAAGGFIAGTGGLSTTGQIFPEALTLFTVRAFAAFYLALAVGIVALLRQPTVGAAFLLGITGVSLIVPTLIAALVNIGAFDLIARPLGILYLAAYVVVLVPAAIFLWQHRAEMIGG